MNVLLVEDDNSHATLIQGSLARAAREIHVLRAPTVHRARELLDDHPVHVVLLDFSLPDGDGLDLLRHIRARFSRLPVIFLTAADSAEVCAQALKGGAVDYLVKKRNYIDVLPGIVRKAWTMPVGQAAEGDAAIVSDAVKQSGAQVGAAPVVEPDDRTRIQTALEHNRWNRARTARDLGVSRITLWRRMWKYNLYP